MSSAGVRVNEGDPICSAVASLHDDAQWQAQAQSHRATPVTIEQIEQASIVLTASRDIRGELVRLAPRSRDWMFTIKEAAHLGEGFASSAPDRVAEYVAHLDRARSRAVPLTPSEASAPACGSSSAAARPSIRRASPIATEAADTWRRSRRSRPPSRPSSLNSEDIGAIRPE